MTPMTISYIISWTAHLLGCLWFVHRRLYRYLRYYQQENYDGTRALLWVFGNKAFDMRGSPVALAASFLCFLMPNPLIVNVTASALLVLIATLEEDPRRCGKVKLIMTKRATRLHLCGLIVYAAVATPLVYLLYPYGWQWVWLVQAFLIQLTLIWLIIANWILHPFEKSCQQRYSSEARDKITSYHPYVIGITGSYGKTSTKEALGQLLQMTLAPTFWPEKGVNTPMGITKEIRHKLKEHHRYAVIEMGAYGIGSIARLCDLTPPNAAIITSVGSAHLERFKSHDNIRHTKGELAQALPADGIIAGCGDDAAVRDIVATSPATTKLLYGFDNGNGDLDCWISSENTLKEGTHFTLAWRGATYDAFTPLHGRTALLNLAAAFTMACTLGGNPFYVLAVIRTINAVDNRLQVKDEGGITWVHDAYNSNPRGFDAALRVVGALPGRRRVVMTPGMIELDSLQYEENRKAAEHAAAICDLAIIVGATNATPLRDGFISGGWREEQIICCDTRDEAFKALDGLKLQGDIILIENDLPDLYESSPRF